METLFVYSDGGAVNNPGPAGIGIVIQDEKRKVLKKISEYIGETTNNQAEYQALVKALETALNLFKANNVQCFLDSQLIVEQLNMRYKVKNHGLRPLFLKVHNLAVKIGNVKFIYIPREQNKEADRLVKMAIKNGLKHEKST